jgi:hypothetical protein
MASSFLLFSFVLSSILRSSNAQHTAASCLGSQARTGLLAFHLSSPLLKSLDLVYSFSFLPAVSGKRRQSYRSPIAVRRPSVAWAYHISSKSATFEAARAMPWEEAPLRSLFLASHQTPLSQIAAAGLLASRSFPSIFRRLNESNIGNIKINLSFLPWCARRGYFESTVRL